MELDKINVRSMNISCENTENVVQIHASGSYDESMRNDKPILGSGNAHWLHCQNVYSPKSFIVFEL